VGAGTGGQPLAGEHGQRREGSGPRRAGTAVLEGETPEGWNPGRGSGVKQTREAGGGRNRRGREKRRGRTGAGLETRLNDAAGSSREEGRATPRKALWADRFLGGHEPCGRHEASAEWITRGRLGPSRVSTVRRTLKRRQAHERMKPAQQWAGRRCREANRRSRQK